MQSQIAKSKVWGDAVKGLNLLNVQKCETVTDLRDGEAENLGWTPKGKIISCLRGSIWVTQEHDLEDYILDEGESFMITIPGRVIIQALEDSSFSVNNRPGKSRFSGSYEKSIFK